MNKFVRLAKLEDLPRIVEVCNEAWNGIFQGDLEMFQSRLKVFPEGLVVGGVDGMIEAYVSFQLVKPDFLPKNWQEAADSGYLTNTHVPNGKIVYGVGMAATPKGREAKVIKDIIRHIVKYAMLRNKQKCYFFSRVSDYQNYQDSMSIGDYVLAKREDGTPLDSQLRTLAKYKLLPKNPPIILEGFMGDSGGAGEKYSVLVERLNPLYIGKRY